MSHVLPSLHRHHYGRSALASVLNAARKILMMSVTLPAALVLAGCAPSIKVNTDFSQNAKFDGYRFYAFANLPPKAAAVNALDPLLTEQARAVIDSNLSKKSMRRVDDMSQANLVIFTWGTTKETIHVDDLGYQYPGMGFYGTSSILVDTQTEGTLVVDMVDPATKQLVWRGIASGTVSDRNEAKKMIPEAINKMLKGFPPKVEGRVVRE